MVIEVFVFIRTLALKFFNKFLKRDTLLKQQNTANDKNPKISVCISFILSIPLSILYLKIGYIQTNKNLFA